MNQTESPLILTLVGFPFNFFYNYKIEKEHLNFVGQNLLLKIIFLLKFI